jgi:hypothetical protein
MPINKSTRKKKIGGGGNEMANSKLKRLLAEVVIQLFFLVNDTWIAA